MTQRANEGMVIINGTLVSHPRYGSGSVEFNKGITAIVRFKCGIEECLVSDLQVQRGVRETIQSGDYDNLREVLARSQAMTIRSINDSWGIFSKSRISLLPHQLWVCHKVLSHWPIQKLIADDVGLGKTIEAGLILWPLLAKKRVRRLLVLTPASLVEQWQERLREMFDIRLSLYSPSIDTERSDYWNSNNLVVASLPTLRNDSNGRHERMLQAEDWDLLIVDEAHHLNSHEAEGATLGYRFVQRLVEYGKFKSRMFFTATPHRGKDYGFFALLKLLSPDQFDPKKDASEQIEGVKQLVIRNNKQSVTDMKGAKIFRPVTVMPRTYHFSSEEQAFYDQLTQFILTGQAYASSLSKSNQRVVQLVLIAMQKLAASSVAAIRSAIRGRISRLADSKQRLVDIEKKMKELVGYFDDGLIPELDDRYIELEGDYAETTVKVALMEDELPMLKKLLKLADSVKNEAKIETLLNILRTDFESRTVVFFTEYKATQGLLINTLHHEFGHGCVSFINGDGRLDNIIQADGQIGSWLMNRYDAADKFTNGDVRFIVCTEAGGEGIDLQRNCYSMIHVDLPWNPMRLHQRVGRLNRYGQEHAVEVVTLRNPDTVESRIWDLLNEKIASVMRALGSAMDEPEDLLQLILGMTDSSIFNQLFSGAVNKDPDGLKQWFDAKAGTFGGRSAVSAVESLVGHSDKFEYDDLAEVPKQDLVDLAKFFESMLKLNGHRLDFQNGHMSFITPKAWQSQYGIRKKYSNLVFDRVAKGKEIDVLGIGHPIMDNALDQAEQMSASVAVAMGLDGPAFIFQIRDQITGEQSNITSVMVAVVFSKDGVQLLKEDTLMRFYAAVNDSMPKSKDVYLTLGNSLDLDAMLDEAEAYLEMQLPEMGLPYRLPGYKVVTGFIPP